MKKRMKLTGFVVAAAMAVTALAGCGGKTTTEAGAAGVGAAGAGAEQGTADNDYSNDVITYGLTAAWDTINPYGSTSGSMHQNLVCDMLYDRLAFIEEAGTAVTARGAKTWESQDDGLSAIFHLDENATWHDGTPVTAKDWVFTARLITDPKFEYGLRSEFNTWAGTTDNGDEESEDSVGVTAVDDYTLKIEFKTAIPVEDWLRLHNKFYYVLPEHLLKDIAPPEIMQAGFWKAPVGSGPCTFLSEMAGSQLELASFADYQLGAPKFLKLIVKVVSPANTITSVSTGEMDAFFTNPTVDDAMAAKSMGANVEQSESATTVAVFLINNQNVKDKRVRQAMSAAIDKDLLIDQQLQGHGIASSTCIIPGSEYDSGIKWERDLSKAEALLTEAGWDTNTVLTMAVTSAREGMAAVIQQNFAEAGIKIEVQTVELATMFSGLQEGTYDLGICGSTAMDYPLWMAGYYDNKNATYCQITDPQYSELQDQIVSEMDPAKKKELVNQYQELLYDEMPLVMLYHGYTFGVKSERLQGYNPFEAFVNNNAIWNWSIAK